MTDFACSIALKEWAVICRALETGQQTLLLRKGGIAEGQGGFRPEHERFWLYPTQFHQTAEQLTPETASLLTSAQELRLSNNDLMLRSLAVVEQVEYLTNLEQILALQGLHGWSEEVVRQRFAYRKAGLFLFLLRVYRTAQMHAVTETAGMAGCKSWVELPDALPTGLLAPVLSDPQFAEQRTSLQNRLFA